MPVALGVLTYSCAGLATAGLAIIALGQAHRLAHNHRVRHGSQPLYVEARGEGSETLVFLHGISASHRYWRDLTEGFSRRYRTLAPDCLGFGLSRWPASVSTLAEHLRVLSKALSDASPKARFFIVGHSFGAQLALHYANAHPTRVKGLVLLGLPVFHSKADAAEKLARNSPREKTLAFHPVWAPLLCLLHSALGPAISGRIFRRLMRGFPGPIAEDSALHTWNSYRSAMYEVLLKTEPSRQIRALDSLPILILQGEDDHDADAGDLEAILRENPFVVLRRVAGDHNFPLRHPAATYREIWEFLAVHEHA